jgi:hypothetical protein
MVWSDRCIALLLFASQFDSPWQVKWQLVQRQTELVAKNPECQLRSIEQDTDTPSRILIKNETKGPVAYYWLDDEGEARFILRVESGKTGEVYAYVGQPACILNTDTGESLQAIYPTDPEQSVTIR